MSVARARALTHTSFTTLLIISPGRNECCPCEGIDTGSGLLYPLRSASVEMSVARARALTHPSSAGIPQLKYVEMSVARARALTPTVVSIPDIHV